jgi:hypothetical protein
VDLAASEVKLGHTSRDQSGNVSIAFAHKDDLEAAIAKKKAEDAASVVKANESGATAAKALAEAKRTGKPVAVGHSTRQIDDPRKDHNMVLITRYVHPDGSFSEKTRSPNSPAEPSPQALKFLARQKAAKSKEAIRKTVAAKSTQGVVRAAEVKRVADVAAEMSESGRTQRVHIGDLRDKFPHLTKEQFDRTLLAAVGSKRHGITIYHADHPSERRPQDEITLPLGNKGHFVYAGGRYRTLDKPRKPKHAR